ncbi:MAG: ubiquinol-cytochrome C chaperone [Alphaproteobacteria bacterium]|nr:MAG: ubiquinol-cytochrome C chaperone [Alphaproteobacteria bacterium]
MVFLRRNKKIKDAAHVLFNKIVAQARTPHFYETWKVADTLDGRFDLIILHMALVINRLEADGDDKKVALLTRFLQEVLFDNMDLSLREMGVGDMSVGKKVKVMAEACYGRIAAYKKAIRSEDIKGNLAVSLSRNIYREKMADDDILSQLVDYTLQQVDALNVLTTQDLMSEKLTFGDIR